MNSKNAPPNPEDYNLKTYFDEKLLECPQDFQSMSDYCKNAALWLDLELNRSESEIDVTLIVKLLGRLAGFYKITKQYNLALEYIKKALSLIEKHNLGIQQFVVQSLRHADILRYQKNFSEAQKLFKDLVVNCQKEKVVQGYLDFVFQHLGKLYFDLTDYKSALDYFEKALVLRNKKQDQELIDSTVFAIQETQKCLLKKIEK